MIRNIIFSFLMFDLVLALSILILWNANNVEPHTIRLGTTLLPLFKELSIQASRTTFRFSKIDEVSSVTQVGVQLAFAANPIMAFIDSFIVPINVFIRAFNFLIECINAFIELLNFGWLLINNLDKLSSSLSQL